MAISRLLKERIRAQKEIYDREKIGKSALLTLLNEAEVSESVYNSNAIENSTLTLKETERILMEIETHESFNIREIYEAKNLARVLQYLEVQGPMSTKTTDGILFLHRMLLAGIDDRIAGRFRTKDEYVRVGSHIASSPEQVLPQLTDAIIQFESASDRYFLDAIARFHLQFESIHPFLDGNGRIGRVLLNAQLKHFGYPSIIIRNKHRQEYYDALRQFDASGSAKMLEGIVARALLESLHKRIAYLRSYTIVPLSAYSKSVDRSLSTLLNSAHRQTIPAFREKGVWKIGIEGRFSNVAR